MFTIKVNKKLIPLKMSFFFSMACIGPVVGFMPTIAKQLGYSLTTYGTTMTFISMMTMVLVPTFGIIVDKFRVKKIFTMTLVLGMGVASLIFIFVPKAPLDALVELKCDRETTLTVYSKKDILTTGKTTMVFNEHDSDEPITCKLNCRNIKFDNEKSTESRDQPYFCDDWVTSVNETSNPHKNIHIDVTFKFGDTERIGNSYNFHVLSVQIHDTKLPSTTCKCSLKTLCYAKCSNQDIMDVVNVTTYTGNVYYLWQYWIFVVVVFTFYSCTISAIMLNPICLDILGDKPEDYGKQKCWGSIGWGSFSILVGWLVDIFSSNNKEKNYLPVFYSCIILTILNLITFSKIKVMETKKTEGRWQNVYGLFSKHYVVAFYIWSLFITLFHAIITHFLFWYMEDMVSVNNDPSQLAWIKTIQGLAQGIQCLGGEIPFFFWSSLIIKKIGHTNCMVLALGAMSLRMFLYTIISNPVWIILIELLNGISYALAFSVKMSYAKIISPPDTTNTVIGLLGFVELFGECVASLLGGYLFDSYGGTWSYRFFAGSSALMCCLNIISNYYGLTKDLKILNTDEITVKTDVNISDMLL